MNFCEYLPCGTCIHDPADRTAILLALDSHSTWFFQANGNQETEIKKNRHLKSTISYGTATFPAGNQMRHWTAPTTSLAVLALLQLSAAVVSESDQPDYPDNDGLDPVKTDNYWVPPINALDVTCGGTSIKTGDGGAYTCFTVGEGICRDNSPGSFGPGLGPLVFPTAPSPSTLPRMKFLGNSALT